MVTYLIVRSLFVIPLASYFIVRAAFVHLAYIVLVNKLDTS